MAHTGLLRNLIAFIVLCPPTSLFFPLSWRYMHNSSKLRSIYLLFSNAYGIYLNIFFQACCFVCLVGSHPYQVLPRAFPTVFQEIMCGAQTPIGAGHIYVL